MPRDPNPRTELGEEYRRDMREVSRQANWTFWKFLPLFLGVIVVLVLVGWGIQASGIIGKNIDREVTQQSQQYTESQQAKLQNLYTEYTDLQLEAAKYEATDKVELARAVEAQQKALIAQMRRITTNISDSEVPEEVRELLDRAR